MSKIKRSRTRTKTNCSKNEQLLPIVFAEQPNVLALAGIWQGKEISLEDLRRKAWGTEYEFSILFMTDLQII